MPRQRLAAHPRRVTVHEVAVHANVSEATVSRIMRNTGLATDATRDRVMQSVRALGYVPNRLAGALASFETRLVGVVIPSLSNIVFPEVLAGIHAGLAGSDHQAVIAVTDYDPGREETAVRGLLAWQPAAVLIAGFDHTDATRRMLAASTGRVVQMMDIDAAPIDLAVGLSHHRAGYDTARHLIARGYRRFGYVGHDWTADRRARLRHDGLCRALAETGLAFMAEARTDGPSSVSAGREQTARLRAMADIDVAVCSNDDMAVGAVFHCLAAGLRMPADLAVFGFNGLDIGRTLPQPLSTVRSNRFAIGQRAVMEVLSTPQRPARSRLIDTGFDIFPGATA